MSFDTMTNSAEERAVLACCLQNQVARDRARGIMSGADFYQPWAEIVWDAMSRLDRQGMPVNPVSVLTVLRGGAATAGTYQQTFKSAISELPSLMGMPVVSMNVDYHATKVRELAVKRRLWDELERAKQLVLNPETDALGLSASIARRFTEVRDTGFANDIETVTVEQLLLEVDEEPDWVVPGFLERGDRFVLTGEEGLGKSHLLRQVAILAHAGLDPFRPWSHIQPVRGMVVDFENTKRQIRRRLGTTYGYAAARSKGDPGQAGILAMPRSDITSDRVLNKLHREIDEFQPDVLVIGPLYKMTPKAIKTDDEAVPVLAALDTIRERGIALLIEAHSGNENNGKKREWRPRGSAALRGWPEFGYGLMATSASSATMVPWRGDREARSFPLGLTRQEGLWVEERPMMVADVWRNEDWSDLEPDDRYDD